VSTLTGHFDDPRMTVLPQLSEAGAASR
jgi:hypothetical protein